MLFNSIEFIYIFLPVTYVIYLFLDKKRLLIHTKVWLIAASLFYYSYWDILYLPLIIGSILCNYTIGKYIIKGNHKPIVNNILLIIGIVLNVGLLCYFKYTKFIIQSINTALSTQFDLIYITLPLAVSFFTFQQIAYLVDCHKNDVREYDFLDYIVFISFFPKLIAGPIVRYREFMPQIKNVIKKDINYQNIATGMFLFFIGLYKKVVVADTFAVWADKGFDRIEILNFFEAWATSISYSLQIYFDFSGYTDMALGIALFFNIKLPINFNSPYKALSIRDFWRRWHITLSRFLGDYIYIPLGGNRRGSLRTYINIMATFLIGGLWHGAGWTFIFWGFLHGLGSIVHRLWMRLGIKMNGLLSWFITFNFVNIAWIFFRARDWSDAIKIIKGMFGFNEIILPLCFESSLSVLKNYGFEFGTSLPNFDGNAKLIVMIFVFLAISVFSKNSMEIAENYKTNWKTALFISAIALWSLLIISSSKINEFVYYNF